MCQPSRDLWAGISAEISESPPSLRHLVTPSRRPGCASPRASLLIVASSMTTYVITQRSAQRAGAAGAAGRANAVAAGASVARDARELWRQEALGAEYLRARAALDAEFQRQIATLPPVTRAKLERNLADLRRAASEISATLAEHPSHPLLQELLLSTYQSELALLGSVSDVTCRH